jgi:hypothetical protein
MYIYISYIYIYINIRMYIYIFCIEIWYVLSWPTLDLQSLARLENHRTKRRGIFSPNVDRRAPRAPRAPEVWCMVVATPVQVYWLVGAIY